MATAAGDEVRIEVSNCSSVSSETLELYFENTRRSGGGEIANITKKGSRYFITYEDQTVANRVVSRSHKLEGHELKVTLCKVGKIDRKRLLIKNISAKTTEDCLIYFVKDIAGSDVIQVDKDEDRKQAVVTFEDALDINNVIGKFEGRPEQKKILDRSKLQLFPINVTSTILINDLPDDVTTDWLELYFENKRRSGGGAVENVTIDPDNYSAKVTFRDSSCVARVLARPHSYQGSNLSVAAFHEDMEDDTEEDCSGLEDGDGETREEEEEEVEDEEEFSSKPAKMTHEQKKVYSKPSHKTRDQKKDYVKSTQKTENHKQKQTPEYSLPINRDLFQFIETNSEQTNQFREAMAAVEAQVVRNFGEDNIRVSSNKIIKGRKEKQEWEDSSQAALAEFFGQYSQTNVSVTPNLFQSVSRDLEETPASILKVSKNEENHEIHLVGKTSDVDKAVKKIRDAETTYLEKLERESRRKTSKIPNQSKGRLFMLQKQLDQIRARHKVDIDIDWKSNSVTFTGCEDDLTTAMCDVYETFNNFKDKYYNPPKRRLIEFLQGKSGKRHLYQAIKEQHLEAGIEVTDNDVIITATSQDTIKAVVGIIERYFKVDEIRSKDDTSGVFEKIEFKSLVEDLQKNSHVQIRVKNEVVDLVGVKQSVEPAVKKIQEFIQANVKTSTFLNVDEHIMRYLRAHKSEGDIDSIRQKLYQMRGKMTLKNTGIFLEGNPDATSEAKRNLQKIVQNIKTKNIKITDTGQCKFFIEGRGEHRAKGIESTVSCAIHINKKGQFEERKDNPWWSSSKIIRQFSSSSASTLDKHGAKFSVKQGDIASEKVDAIVNSISSDIEDPFRGGISKAILTKAGDDLKKEAQTLGSLNVGDVKSTGSGKLKCKRVYHCVLDKWNGGAGNKILRNVVKESLHKASRAKFTSIAFPSLGTGFLRFPHQKAAETMIQEVLFFAQKNQHSSVKDIRFIVFDSDSVDAFNNELASYQERDRATHPGQSLSGREEKHAKFASVTFDIQGGDLTRERIDAIMNPVAPNLDQGQVGRALINAGGNSIDDEYRQQKLNLHNGPILTGAGNLKPKGIIHMICPSAADLARELETCLKFADTYGLQSIALPAIGTGHFGLSVNESASGIIEGVKRFSRSNPQSLTAVKVVIFQHGMVSDFARKLGDVVNGGRQTLATGHGNKVHASPSPTRQVRGPPEVTITIIADNDADITKAEKELQKIIKEEIIEDKIENEFISQLDDADVRRVKAIGVHNNVEVKTDSDKQKWYNFGKTTNRALHLKGLKADVEKYKSQIHTWLDKYERAAGLKRKVKWYYVDGSTKSEFDTMWNYDLETARISGEKAVFLMAEDASPAYRVDFKTMKETDVRRNKTFKLERRGPDGAGVELPENWDPFPKNHKPEDPHLVSLNKGSEEYQLVEKGFLEKSDGNKPKVMKIERIQHKLQYQIYTLRKRALEQKYPKNRNQRRLYHGTKPDTVGIITSRGFNRSYAGSAVGAREGKGVYFAVRSGYSMKSYYSPADKNGDRFMFQVKVLVGKTCPGNPNMVEPDLIPGTNGDRYDTSTDNVQNPNMYVTFHDEQAYPEYLITFR